MSRRNLCWGAAGLLLLAVAAYGALHGSALRKATYLRFFMHEAAPGVLVKNGLPEAREREFLDLAAAGRARAEAWFGPLQGRAQIVFAHDPVVKSNLGVAQPYAWNPAEENNARLYIGPKGLSADFLAHGLAHVEIKTRLGLDLWPALPAWFDEGLATQVDWRRHLLPEALAAAPDAAPATLAALATHDAFRGDDGDARLVVAKREVSRWLALVGGRQAADALFAAMRAGEAFDQAYARIEGASRTTQ